MVGAQENRAVVRGRVVAVDAAQPGWCTLELRVDGVTPVTGYPMMVDREEGDRLGVLTPESDAAGLRPGARVQVTVERRSPQDVVVRPASVRRLDEEGCDDHGRDRPV